MMSSDTFHSSPFEGLSIAQFSRRYRLPQRRVLREVKRTAIQELGEEAREAYEAGEAWQIDLTEAFGYAVWYEDGGARIQYAVTDAGLLLQQLKAHFGIDLLTDEQISRIVEAARQYYSSAVDENSEYILVERNDRNRPFSPKMSWFNFLDEALRRMGR